MLTLTAQDLMENARKAYLDGKLIAQLPQDKLEESRKRFDIFQLWQTSDITCVCAVGASVPMHVREKTRGRVTGFSSGSINHLIDYEHEASTTYADLIDLHDQWMSARLGVIKNPGPAQAEALFKSYVGVQQ